MAETFGTLSQVNIDAKEQIALITAFASDAVETADRFLTNLTNAGFSVTIADVELANINITAPTFELGALPKRPTQDIEDALNRLAEEPPLDFKPEIDDRTFGNIPAYDVTRPVINFPDEITYVEPVSPGIPTITQDQFVPERPTDTLPEDLTIGDYTIPAFIAVELPAFLNEPLPSLDGIVVPTQPFTFNETEYLSTLKDAVFDKLLNDIVVGGSGLNATTETAIYDRAIERETQRLNDAVDRKTGVFGATGFSVPNSVLNGFVSEEIEKHDDRKEEINRDILIKQAELAQVNTHFILDKSITLEQVTIEHADRVQSRALETSKSVADFAMAVFNAQVSFVTIALERYKADAVRINAVLEIEKVKLENYRASLLEAETLGDIDKNKIADFASQVDRHNAVRAMFLADLESVGTKLNVQRLKMDFFKDEITKYVSDLEGQKTKAEFNIAQIRGEDFKLDTFKTDVDVYSVRLTAAVEDRNAERALLDANIDEEKMKLASFLANMDRYRIKADVALKEVDAVVKVYLGDIDAFTAEVDFLAKQADLDLETLLRGHNIEIENIRIAADLAKAQLNADVERSSQKVTRSAGAADGFTSIAASALSAMNAIYSISSEGVSTEEVT